MWDCPQISSPVVTNRWCSFFRSLGGVWWNWWGGAHFLKRASWVYGAVRILRKLQSIVTLSRCGGCLLSCEQSICCSSTGVASRFYLSLLVQQHSVRSQLLGKGHFFVFAVIFDAKYLEALTSCGFAHINSIIICICWDNTFVHDFLHLSFAFVAFDESALVLGVGHCVSASPLMFFAKELELLQLVGAAILKEKPCSKHQPAVNQLGLFLNI